MWRVPAGGKDQLSVHSQWAAGRQGTEVLSCEGRKGGQCGPSSGACFPDSSLPSSPQQGGSVAGAQQVPNLLISPEKVL